MGTKTFLRRRQVEAITGLSTSSIYELMSKGLFPKNFNLSENRVAWDSDDIAKWQRERLATRTDLGAEAA